VRLLVRKPARREWVPPRVPEPSSQASPTLDRFLGCEIVVSEVLRVPCNHCAFVVRLSASFAQRPAQTPAPKLCFGPGFLRAPALKRFSSCSATRIDSRANCCGPATVSPLRAGARCHGLTSAAAPAPAPFTAGAAIFRGLHWPPEKPLSSGHAPTPHPRLPADRLTSRRLESR
jgi:hypothetical protein